MAKGCFINNEWVKTAHQLPVLSPWSGETLDQVSLAGEEEWEAALAAAKQAAISFKKFSSLERRQLLEKLAAGVQARQEELAQTIVAEGGKPVTYARAEMGRGAQTLSLAAEEAARVGGEVIPLDSTPASRGRWGITRRFPLGPVLGISPFNFPFNLVAHKVGPALAAGNPIIVKPASATPLTALLLAEIYEQAGLPPGGLQVLPSPYRVTEKYAADERLKALSFTGSAAVGWRLKALAGRQKVILELGGNAACIVDRDADLELAAARLTIGAFYHAGQVCIATKRLLVHRDIYQDFRDIFLKTVKEKALAGDPSREETLVGPFIDAGAGARVRECVEEALRAGARLAAGGLGEGNLMPATVLEGVGRDFRVWQEEVFGPVLVLAPFAEFSEALNIANDTIYGLQAGVFTRNLAHWTGGGYGPLRRILRGA